MTDWDEWTENIPLPPTHPDGPHRMIRRCDANAKKGTGTGICDRILDNHGQCDRAAQHVSQDGS